MIFVSSQLSGYVAAVAVYVYQPFIVVVETGSLVSTVHPAAIRIALSDIPCPAGAPFPSPLTSRYLGVG